MDDVVWLFSFESNGDDDNYSNDGDGDGVIHANKIVIQIHWINLQSNQFVWNKCLRKENVTAEVLCPAKNRISSVLIHSVCIARAWFVRNVRKCICLFLPNSWTCSASHKFWIFFCGQLFNLVWSLPLHVVESCCWTSTRHMCQWHALLWLFGIQCTLTFHIYYYISFCANKEVSNRYRWRSPFPFFVVDD